MQKINNQDFSLISVSKKFGGDKARNLSLCLITAAMAGSLAVLPYYLVWRLIALLLENYQSFTSVVVRKYALFIFLTQVISACLNLYASTLSHKLAFRVENNLRKVQMSHLLDLPAGFFAKSKSGKLRRLIDDNASRTHQLIAHLMPDMAAAFAGPAVLIVLILTVDIRFGLISIAGLILSFLALTQMMSTENKERMNKYFLAGEKLGTTGTEFFRGIPVVKVFNQSVHSMRALIESIEDYSKLCLQFSFGSRISMIFYTVALYLPTVAVLPLAAYLMKKGEDPLKILASALFYVVVTQLFNGAFMRLLTVTSASKSYELVGEKINYILSLEPLKIEEKPEAAKELQDFEIAIEDLDFTYPDRDHKALKDINLNFEKSKSYALVGRSGAGKSSLIKLIARYYDPDKGAIYLRGKNIKNLSEDELYDKMAIVFQENKLFKSSLRENLAMGHEYSDEQLLQALKQANACDILERMPAGLDTVLGTKGTYLSGGEIQRVAIARAFLKPADILLLDEATASADLENEARIYEALERLKSGKTTIMITHRMHNVQKADKIIVFDQGEVIAEGKHEELLEKSEVYRDLYNEYRKALDWRIEKKVSA